MQQHRERVGSHLRHIFQRPLARMLVRVMAPCAAVGSGKLGADPIEDRGIRYEVVDHDVRERPGGVVHGAVSTGEAVEVLPVVHVARMLRRPQLIYTDRHDNPRCRVICSTLVASQ
jgi:hypothetical protein